MIKVFASGLFMIMLFYPIVHLLWTFVFVRHERLEKEFSDNLVALLDDLKEVKKNEM